MKQFETILPLVTVFLALSFLSLSPATAAIADYQLNLSVNEQGNTHVELLINPAGEGVFKLSFRGDMQNFNANTDCRIQTVGVSIIECEFGQPVSISFETAAFVNRVSESRRYFSSDFMVNQPIAELSATLALPDGMILTDKNQTQFAYVVYPETANIFSDGRRIFLNWRLSGLKANNPQRFEVLYEQLVAPPWFQLQLRHFIFFGGAFALVFSLIYLRYFKKSEKLVLAVLDEYERRVVDILMAAGEPVKQRRVVLETNFSKAKVSRVVRSLAERGLIEVERRGRTNLLKLLKKKLQV